MLSGSIEMDHWPEIGLNSDFVDNSKIMFTY